MQSSEEPSVKCCGGTRSSSRLILPVYWSTDLTGWLARRFQVRHFEPIQKRPDRESCVGAVCDRQIHGCQRGQLQFKLCKWPVHRTMTQHRLRHVQTAVTAQSAGKLHSTLPPRKSLVLHTYVRRRLQDGGMHIRNCLVPTFIYVSLVSSVYPEVLLQQS